MAAPKRTPYQIKANTQSQLMLRMRGVRPGVILQTINEERQQEARQEAIRLGLNEEETEKRVKNASLSAQSLSRDLRAITDKIDGAAENAAEMLVLERIDELRVEVLSVDGIEAEAWKSYASSKKREGGADPRWMAIALKCGERRQELGERIFELAARLRLASMAPEAIEKLKLGTIEALEEFAMTSLQLLLGAEAQLLGEPGMAEQRTKLLMSFLSDRKPGGGPGGPAAGQVYELRVREIGSGES